MINHPVTSKNKALKLTGYSPPPDVIRRKLGHCDRELTEELTNGLEEHPLDDPIPINRPVATTNRQVEITPEVVNLLRLTMEPSVLSKPVSPDGIGLLAQNRAALTLLRRQIDFCGRDAALP